MFNLEVFVNNSKGESSAEENSLDDFPLACNVRRRASNLNDDDEDEKDERLVDVNTFRN